MRWLICFCYCVSVELYRLIRSFRLFLESVFLVYLWNKTDGIPKCLTELIIFDRTVCVKSFLHRSLFQIIFKQKSVLFEQSTAYTNQRDHSSESITVAYWSLRRSALARFLYRGHSGTVINSWHLYVAQVQVQDRSVPDDSHFSRILAFYNDF